MPGLPLLYIGGSGRSGSTLLGRVAGLVPGFVNVGELMFLWGRGIGDNQLCGCGEAFWDCSFWTAVGEAAYGGWTSEIGERGERLRAAVERNRFVPGMAQPRLLSARRRSDLAAYAELFEPVYRAVHQVSGAAVIVETSKGPAHASVLRHVRAVELKVCLLVRDSRGVAYSWTKVKKRPEIRDGDAYMDTYAPWRVTAEWAGFAAAFTCASLVGVPTMRMRYEDLVVTPQDELERLVRFADPARTTMPEVFRDRKVTLVGDHSVAGNPDRFTVGETELRPDEEWREQLPAGQRAKMTAMTFPWLLRYGYLGRDHSKSRPR